MADNTPNHMAFDYKGLTMRLRAVNVDNATATLVSNAATVTKYAVQVTTESLVTASAASQALTLTLTGVSATDLAFVQAVGGTNTRKTYIYEAACTANTVTITANPGMPTPIEVMPA